jgi:hypothetical protein
MKRTVTNKRRAIDRKKQTENVRKRPVRHHDRDRVPKLVENHRPTNTSNDRSSSADRTRTPSVDRSRLVQTKSFTRIERGRHARQWHRCFSRQWRSHTGDGPSVSSTRARMRHVHFGTDLLFLVLVDRHWLPTENRTDKSILDRRRCLLLFSSSCLVSFIDAHGFV